MIRELPGQLELFADDGVIHVTTIHREVVTGTLFGEPIERDWFTWSCTCGSGSIEGARSSHIEMTQDKVDRHLRGEI